MALDPREYWVTQAVKLGRWFKENCLPCEICGELTCDHGTHIAMHNATNERFQALEDQMTALEERVTALETPPG